MAQPMFLIVATRRCTTHRPGTRIWFTGPRNSVARGWRVVAGPYRDEHYGGTV